MDYKLFSTTKGTGDNLILFLHGLWGGGNYFRELDFSDLDNTTQIFPDEIGFGKSEKPDIEYTPELHCRLLEQSLPKKVQVTIIAHSFGTVLALQFLELYPERVKQIILVSPLIYKNTEEAEKYLSTNFISKLTIEKPLLTKVICKSVCSTGILGKVSPFFVTPARRKFIGGCTQHTWHSYYSTFTNCILKHPTFDVAKKNKDTIPMLLIYGDQDNYANYENTNQLSGKSITKIEVIDADHYILFEKFEEVKGEIKKWI